MTSVKYSFLDKNRKSIQDISHICFAGIDSQIRDALGGKGVYVAYYPRFKNTEENDSFLDFLETFPFFRDKEESGEEFKKTHTITIDLKKVSIKQIVIMLTLARYVDEFPEFVRYWNEHKKKKPFERFVIAHQDIKWYSSGHTLFSPLPLKKGALEDLAKIFDPSKEKFRKKICGDTFYGTIQSTFQDERLFK